jgi:hypothetical protein
MRGVKNADGSFEKQKDSSGPVSVAGEWWQKNQKNSNVASMSEAPAAPEQAKPLPQEHPAQPAQPEQAKPLPQEHPAQPAQPEQAKPLPQELPAQPAQPEQAKPLPQEQPAQPAQPEQAKPLPQEHPAQPAQPEQAKPLPPEQPAQPEQAKPIPREQPAPSAEPQNHTGGESKQTAPELQTQPAEPGNRAGGDAKPAVPGQNLPAPADHTGELPQPQAGQRRDQPQAAPAPEFGVPNEQAAPGQRPAEHPAAPAERPPEKQERPNQTDRPGPLEPNDGFHAKGELHTGRLVSNYGDAYDQRHPSSGGVDGHLTAALEPFNHNAMTAASRTLPFGTHIRVTDEATGKSVVVRVNDRGPFHRPSRKAPYDRDLDLTFGAAKKLGNTGVPTVSWQIVEPNKS